jgi:predicted ester cyclase
MNAGPAVIVRGMFEALDRRDWDRFGQYIADDIAYLDTGRAEPITGAKAYLETARRMVVGHPDIQFHLQTVFPEGNRVAAEGMTTETIKDKQISFRCAEVFEVEGGRIRHARFCYDSAEINRQLEQ